MISYLVYILGIISTIIMLYFSEKINFIKELKNKNVICKFIFTFICFLPLILIFSLRENVGTDYQTYETMFYNTISKKRIIHVIFNHYIEPGWVILMYISSFFSQSFLLFKFIISSIFCTYLTALIQEEKSSVKLLTVFLCYIFLFFPFMNITRQILASLILIYSLKKYLNGKIIYACIHVFIAFLIHKSALCFILVFLLHYIYKKNISIKIKDKKIKIFKILEWLLILSPIYIIPLNSILFIILKNLNINSNYIYNSLDINITYYFYILPLIILYKYFANNYLEKNDKPNNHEFIYYIFLFSIFFQSLGTLFLSFERLSIYFFALTVVLFPSLLKSNSKLNNKTFYSAICIYCFLYFIVMYQILNGQECFPYQII